MEPKDIVPVLCSKRTAGKKKDAHVFNICQCLKEDPIPHNLHKEAIVNEAYQQVAVELAKRLGTNLSRL